MVSNRRLLLSNCYCQLSPCFRPWLDHLVSGHNYNRLSNDSLFLVCLYLTALACYITLLAGSCETTALCTAVFCPELLLASAQTERFIGWLEANGIEIEDVDA